MSQKSSVPQAAKSVSQVLTPDIMEVTKWLKPSISVSRMGDSASVCQAYETGIQTIFPNTTVLLPATAGLNVPWLKLRSGTRSRPINQAADRTFTMVFGD